MAECWHFKTLIQFYCTFKNLMISDSNVSAVYTTYTRSQSCLTLKLLWYSSLDIWILWVKFEAFIFKIYVLILQHLNIPSRSSINLSHVSCSSSASCHCFFFGIIFDWHWPLQTENNQQSSSYHILAFVSHKSC